MTQQKTNRNPLIIIWIVLATSLGFNIFQGLNIHQLRETYESKVDNLLSSSATVEKELNDTYSELNKYKGISSNLDSLLEEAKGKVDEQKSRIDELVRHEKNSSVLNKKLQLELASLKSMKEDYLEKIDALLLENEQLKKDKTDLATTVESLSKNLEKTVNTAAVLKSEYFHVSAYKKRSNNKYAATVIAKRTNKIEACFVLLENTIAKPGMRNIYLRIIEPGGKILGDRIAGSNTFRKSGSEEDLLYTGLKQIDYQNSKQDLCIFWEDAERTFSSGTYMVEVYVEGFLSGVSSINLR